MLPNFTLNMLYQLLPLFVEYASYISTKNNKKKQEWQKKSTHRVLQCEISKYNNINIKIIIILVKSGCYQNLWKTILRLWDGVVLENGVTIDNRVQYRISASPP